MSDAAPRTETEPEIRTETPPAEVPSAETPAEVPAGTPAEDGPAAPAPLDIPRTPTGDARVDALLERLGDAGHLPTEGHIEVYEDVHRGLRDALTALDARPGPPAPPSTYGSRS
ncbi:hypothetical protein [Streptomyces fumanus]|uniref:Uncharacterized protein n=1 Tax=Streptomyces fumanus TaxID=67302 RepID=A0A919E388_9ACTN|nr:hypothetical protein [Streptomyces fumanus]GHF15081.1 hypothetical protein GCM10018772_45170 [Streptomyces fumanus]